MNKTLIFYLFVGILSACSLQAVKQCKPRIICQACTSCSTDCCNPCDCCDNDCCHTTTGCKTYLAKRSQGTDTARWMMGLKAFINMWDCDGKTTAIMITPGFSRSFRIEELAPCFLPSCDSNCLQFTTDMAETDTSNILRPDDFGLSGTGTVCICPQLSNFFIDFAAYLDLGDCVDGLFFELHAPLVHTWWSPNCDSCALASTCSAEFPSCLMSLRQSLDENDNPVPTPVGTTDIKRALRGNFTWPDVENELCFGVICKDRIQETRLAEVRLALGYYAYKCDRWGVAVKLVGAIPAGNVPEAQFLFEPVVGNGGHGELGGGLMAHARAYECANGGHWDWYLDGYVTHMFKSRTQRRLFDLKNNGCFSRYLLLKQFATNGDLIGLERGPNVFAQPMKVRIDVQGDVSTMFSYHGSCWTGDIGYNFWGRSKEKCQELGCCIPEGMYGIKGTLPVCSFTGNEQKPLDADVRTASTSTINSSSGTQGDDDGPEPTFVTCDDLDICSTLNPSAHTHSVFFNAGYSSEDADYNSFFGVGGKVEFAPSCQFAVEQWHIWASGSVNF